MDCGLLDHVLMFTLSSVKKHIHVSTTHLYCSPYLPHYNTTKWQNYYLNQKHLCLNFTYSIALRVRDVPFDSWGWLWFFGEKYDCSEKNASSADCNEEKISKKFFGSLRSPSSL